MAKPKAVFYGDLQVIDTIIFDLDGTLLNTLEDLTDSVNYMLAQYGFPTHTVEEVRMYVGNGVRLLVERALPADKKQMTDECLKVFSAHYDKNKANKTRPYDGINEMLAQVRSAGFKTAIVSNKYEKAVKALAAEEFGGMIDAAVGEREGMRPKPAPDGVYEAMRLLGATRQTAVYVGDSDVDVMTAKNAGLKMIGVEWGFRDKELLKSLGADVTVSSPSRILQAVKSI